MIVYELVSVLTLIASESLQFGLTLIVFELVSVLTLKASESLPFGLTLIVYELVSVLTLKASESLPINLHTSRYKIGRTYQETRLDAHIKKQDWTHTSRDKYAGKHTRQKNTR